MRTILTCALTGAFDTVSKNPAVPVTPAQLADSAIEAAKAGAAIVHIHVRDPETTQASMEFELYREVVERIRNSGTDMVINLTTGAGGRYIPSKDDPSVAASGTTYATPEKRVAHVLALKPEICTLDVGTLNFGENPFMNTPAHLRAMAEMIRDAGVKPEIEVFDTGHIVQAQDLINAGLITGRPMFQICLGIKYGAPADVEALVSMRRRLPANAHWGAFGVAQMQFPLAAVTAAMGGNVRVGLEDNLYLSRGVLAPSNRELVERAVVLCEAQNVTIATPDEAREILGLTGR